MTANIDEGYRQYLVAWKRTFGDDVTKGIWRGQSVAKMTEEQCLKAMELLEAAIADWEQARQTCDGAGMLEASGRCDKYTNALLL